MLNFTLFKRRLLQILYNIYFFQTIGKLPSTRPALQMDITSQCNLRCKGCYHFSSPPPPDLSDEDLFAFLENKMKKGYKKLWIFGGEPSLRANLFDYIDKHFIEVQVVSNGTIKIDPKYRWRLWISLDGPKEVNDEIRGIGSFEKITQNYKGDRRVGLVMTVNKTNYQHIPYMVNLVKEMGVRSISFTFYSRCEGEYCDEFDFSPEDLKAIEKILMKEMGENKKYIMLDPATLRSILYGKISHPRWNNHCFFAEALIDSYNSSGVKRKCCTENIVCESCRILSPHQFHCLMVSRKTPWLEYAFK